MESGLQQGCQETELPLEVPAGELSQLQVQVLQPCVSEAEAQELKQVRTEWIYDIHQCGIFMIFIFAYVFLYFIIKKLFGFSNMYFHSSIPNHNSP